MVEIETLAALWDRHAAIPAQKFDKSLAGAK